MEQAVAALLQDTLDPARSRDATRALETAALQRGFAISLLQISGAPAVPEAVRQAAATCFKNHVRRYWVRCPLLPLVLGTSRHLLTLRPPPTTPPIPSPLPPIRRTTRSRLR